MGHWIMSQYWRFDLFVWLHTLYTRLDGRARWRLDVIVGNRVEYYSFIRSESLKSAMKKVHMIEAKDFQHSSRQSGS